MIINRELMKTISKNSEQILKSLIKFQHQTLMRQLLETFFAPCCRIRRLFALLRILQHLLETL
jgi:hypothetical protein